MIRKYKGKTMKKQIILISLCFILVLSSIQVASATSVFLTSDHIGSQDNDLDMLSSVKNYIEQMSNGEIEVIIDDYAPSPGEGTRAIESNADVSVNFAANDPGNFLILAKAKQNIDKQIIFVNVGNFDLDNEDYLRRAWDDNYSSTYFAGITTPGTFLKESGIDYIQPLKQFPDAGETYTSSNDEINRYIAEQIVNKVYDKNTNNYYDENLIVTHNIHPSIMADASRLLVSSEDTSYENTYNSYSAPQILYMSSSYLNGNSLIQPSNYDQPDNPLQTSIFAKDSYSVYDYMKMGSMIKTFMDENGRAPNYVNYEGAYLAYPDIVYNFARITENHTESSKMDFASTYRFDKVNHSVFIDSLPYIIVALILLLIYGAIRKIKNHRKRRNNRRYRR